MSLGHRALFEATLLDITASEVEGLEGISALVQLETLRIFDANLSDVQPIEQKTDLKTLCLGSCHLSGECLGLYSASNA